MLFDVFVEMHLVLHLSGAVQSNDVILVIDV